MDRRQLLKAAAAGATVAAVSSVSAALLNSRDRVRVAFLLAPGANVVDTAGPWEVFQDSVVAGRPAFEIYTVAASRDVVTMTGGLLVQPNYAFDEAPPPHAIVIPAMRATDAGDRWIRQASATADVTMSICTGAFHLARLGLLDGLAATTHHDFYDSFEARFPKVELRRGRRFVDNGRIKSAGGLTSGIDLALHVVALYFGDGTAAATAAYMEHDGDGWRTGARAA